MNNKDYYKILGLSKDASIADIKRAYRKLAHKYHPDKAGKDGEEKFKEVNEAYQVLSDPAKRRQYDQFGSAGFEYGPAGAGAGPGGFGFDYSNFANQGFDFSGGFGDIFDLFFGSRGRSRAESRVRRGADLERDIEINSADVYHGIKKEIKIQHHEKCEKCNGTGAKSKKDLTNCSVCSGKGYQEKIQSTILGQIRSRTVCSKCDGFGKEVKVKCEKCRSEGIDLVTKSLEVKIPKGIRDGSVIRLSGQGEAIQFGEPGDLFITVFVSRDKRFKREGDDLFHVAKIPLSLAVLGGSMDVPTIEREIELKIPSGTASHTIFRLKNKGMPKLHRSGFGDLFVQVKIAIPKRLSGKEKELFKKLSLIEKEKEKSPFSKIKKRLGL